MAAIGDGTIDVVFTSNFFEHMPDKRALLRTLDECRRVLRPGGRLLVLMPNLRYVGAALLGLLRPPPAADPPQPGRGPRAGRLHGA